MKNRTIAERLFSQAAKEALKRRNEGTIEYKGFKIIHKNGKYGFVVKTLPDLPILDMYYTCSTLEEAKSEIDKIDN